MTKEELLKLSPGELTDLGICPTCFNRENGGALYGDLTDKMLYEDDDIECFFVGNPRAEGHMCIAAIAHYHDMSEAPDEINNKIIRFAKRFMRILCDVYGCERVYLCTMCDGSNNHYLKFSTYAVPMIIGEIRRYLRDNNSIRVSRSLRDTAYKAIYAREAFVRKNNREPSVCEVAEEIGICKEDIVFAMDAIQSPMSLYEPVFTEGGDKLCIMDQVKDTKNTESTWVENLALHDAMHRLGKRERRIIDLRFFQGKTQMEVAAELSISQAQISRIEKSALRNMRNYLQQ